MMVESLLDVLLQTLLSIMSKSHSVETSRGQRCPQCTAEITVSFHLMCLFDAQSKQVEFSEYLMINLSKYLRPCLSPSLVQGEYVSCLLSLLRQMTEIHFHHLLNNFHSKEELKVGNSLSHRAEQDYSILLWPAYWIPKLQNLCQYIHTGVPVEDLLCVSQSDETDYLPP